MKSALNSIMISSIFAVGGILSLLFNLMGDQDWIWNWVGLLLAYLSLGILIGLYNKTVDHKTFPKILKRTLFISFNVTILGIIMTSSKGTYARIPGLQGLLLSVPLTPQQVTVNPNLCWRLPKTHIQVWLKVL
mgnify:CR=1 FL=1